MSRYIERAENLARLVDVANQSLLDFGSTDEDHFTHCWEPVLTAAAQGARYATLKKDESDLDVGTFFTFSEANPESIRGCIASARENARMVRDQISDELWRDLNALYLFLHSGEAEIACERDGQKFYDRIRKASLLFQGVADATIPHREGWNFMRLGRYIERADKTSRILDIKSYVPVTAAGKSAITWGTVLRCCSAQSAYRQEFGSKTFSDSVAQLLVFSRDFPRSIRSCLGAIDDSLHAISGVPVGCFSNEPERLTGGTLARLNFSSSADAFDQGLNHFLDDLQLQLNTIGQAIFETYVLISSEMTVPPATPQVQFQQQAQQQ